MAEPKIDVGKLSDEIARLLGEWSTELGESIEKAADEVSKRLVEDIKRDSPVKTGEYKSGWTRKKTNGTYTVYNAKKPGLTMILENGRAKKSGGRTKAMPHIWKNRDNAQALFESKITQTAKGGGDE